MHITPLYEYLNLLFYFILLEYSINYTCIIISNNNNWYKIFNVYREYLWLIVIHYNNNSFIFCRHHIRFYSTIIMKKKVSSPCPAPIIAECVVAA